MDNVLITVAYLVATGMKITARATAMDIKDPTIRQRAMAIIGGNTGN